jgi:single-strand DNA-binding protein
MVTWRVVVDRPTSHGHGPAFDVVDCVAWSARTRRSALAWAVGDVVAIDGALRRRFWRSPGGLQSRCEVEVIAARRVAVAATPIKRRRKPG